MSPSIRFCVLPRAFALAMLLLNTLALQSPSRAQSIDELQQRIDAAKKAEADKAAEAELVKRKQAEGAKKTEQARFAEEERSDAALTTYIVDQGNGVLRDVRSGLEWTQRDNGTGINWNDAQTFCIAKGGGWRLPNVDELETIYDKNVVGSICVAFSGFSFHCKTSRLFRLTYSNVWTSTLENSNQAKIVDLNSGGRSYFPLDRDESFRALCVRRP